MRRWNISTIGAGNLWGIMLDCGKDVLTDRLKGSNPLLIPDLNFGKIPTPAIITITMIVILFGW